MGTNWKDKSWQEEFLNMKLHSTENVRLLIEGPKGFIDVLKLGSLHEEYKQLKKGSS